ncbi:MAG TPA: ATP-binding protein [Verrucomicrobiae bacterium]|nr:ATP-binding protein [Verrucomicrobiae bacterium]
MPDPVWQIAPDDISLAVAKLSLDGNWLAANRGLCEWLGSTFAEVSKIPFGALFVPRNPSEQQSLRSQLLAGEIAHYWSEGNATINGGKILQVRIAFCLTSDKQSILAVVSDLKSLRLAEAALKESETARHELARRLTNAQEKERTRIARELHDDIGQALAILRIQMLRAGQPVSGMIGKRHPTIPQLCDNLKSLAEKVSRISHQLHSSELEYLGLAIAVQSHCREFSEKYKIPLECTCEGIPENLDSLLALSLLRIVQEALYNAGKYSKAASIQVALQGSPTELSLLISDDGVGFDPDEAKLAAGLGLISMRERVHLANGEFKIDSQPGEGTCIMARIPLSDANGTLKPVQQGLPQS